MTVTILSHGDVCVPYNHALPATGFVPPASKSLKSQFVVFATFVVDAFSHVMTKSEVHHGKSRDI